MSRTHECPAAFIAAMEPSDVDPADILAKLKAWKAGGRVVICYAPDDIVVQDLIDLIETLQQTALNGSECSKCRRKPTEPECMYCHKCFGKLANELEAKQ